MNTRKIITMSLLGFALVLGACDKGADKAAKGDKQAKADKGEATKTDGKDAPAVEEAPPLDPKVEKAVTLANQISASPGEADTILSDAGLDREAFEQLLYEIAKDPELSQSYAVARDA